MFSRVPPSELCWNLFVMRVNHLWHLFHVCFPELKGSHVLNCTESSGLFAHVTAAGTEVQLSNVCPCCSRKRHFRLSHFKYLKSIGAQLRLYYAWDSVSHLIHHICPWGGGGWRSRKRLPNVKHGAHVWHRWRSRDGNWSRCKMSFTCHVRGNLISLGRGRWNIWKKNLQSAFQILARRWVKHVNLRGARFGSRVYNWIRW